MITPERWQKAKELFHSALEHAPEERASFLSKACEGDKAMRQEVESLLAANDGDDGFLSQPAYEVAAGMLAGEASLPAGQLVAHYKIIAPLGVGGMGEVYLAQDVTLGRSIALKILPVDFARDERRVRRFEQEARAASALNHPNVCVIHEIGRTEDGRHFIAMEHIEGMTLRQRMAQKRLTVGEVLDIAAQVAGALAAAHAARIVHRDIKPENVMLRHDGYVKVLDFGLAKQTDSLPNRQNLHEASTIAHVHTEPGMLMGTVKYMSPEQLREQPVDERTDIWSLGVVLHEMASGLTPFEAPTTNDTIALILEKQPPAFVFTDDVPPDFQRVIEKALSKKVEDRYQTARELASDLKQLRHQYRRQNGIEPSAHLLAQKTLSHPGVSGRGRADTASASAIIERVKSQAIWTAEFIISEIREHPKAAIFTGATAIFAILLLLIPRSQPRSPSYQMTPLTSSGKSVCAAISPDGKSVAHVEQSDGKQELLLTSIATAGTSVVVPAGEFNYRGLTFSRDGNYLYFTRIEKGDVGTLYQVALPGSAPRKMKEHVDSPITFSPKGDRFSFVRLNRTNFEYYLMIAGIDGTGERAVATRRDGNRFSVDGPAWSPDEKTIACAVGWWDKGYHMSLVEFDVVDGHERPVSNQQWFSILQVVWLEDKSGLIISARERPVSPSQLWRISYPKGESVRITNDFNDYYGVSSSHDAETLVSVKRDYRSQIWIAPEGDAQRARAIASKSEVGASFGLSWTDKGKIVFSSMRGENLNISAVNPDGSDQTQLTVNAGDNYTPATSADGGLIVFASNRTGSFNIWRMNADDGSDARQLTFTDGNFYPSCSPDGQWVFYDQQSKAGITIWKVPINGGAPVQVTDKYSRMPVVSPDNNFIACRYDVEGGTRGIAILPVQGGAPVKFLPISAMPFQRVQWINEGRALAYINTGNGTANIWSYDLASGATKQLTDFKTDQIFSYAWSPDYKQLVCERGGTTSDVTVITYQK